MLRAYARHRRGGRVPEADPVLVVEEEDAVADVLEREGGGSARLGRLARPSLGLEELPVLDRERSAVSGRLQKLRVGLVEPARRERADVEHAERASLHDERHAEERADPFLAQERVQDFGMVHVLDRDRAPVGDDVPGEAAADRDRDAALDLLLESLRSARDQLLAAFVHEQDRRGVGRDQVACPCYECLEAPGARCRRPAARLSSATAPPPAPP